jgi:signal transduction histidine kinase
MLELRQLLHDATKVLSGGKELQDWAVAMLNVFLPQQPPSGSGGLLVPQVGEGAGREMTFVAMAPPEDCCISSDDIGRLTSKAWQDLITEPRKLELNCHRDHEHYSCAIVPISYGFDRPVGYFWLVAPSGPSGELVRSLDLTAYLLALHFHSAIARTALEQLSQPIWVAASTTKESADQVARLCLRALACADVIIWELNPVDDTLRTLAVAGEAGSNLIVDLHVGAGLAGTCAQDNQPVLIDDLLDVKQIEEDGYPAPTHPQLIIKNGWRAAMYLPLDIGGRNAGVMAAFALRPRAFSSLDCNIAMAFAQRLCASYVHIERFKQLKEMEDRISIEAPAIEAGIMAMERVHDADNSLLLAQSHLSEIVTRFKQDKKHPVHLSAEAASGHVDAAHKSIKRLVQRAKITKPHLVERELKPLIEAAVSEVKLHAETIRASIKVDCASYLEVKCDKDLLHRVFINILHNALFFLETDQKSGDRVIRIQADAANQEVVIRLLDNGPGIAPHDLHKVFNYFYTSKGERGMGFGLAIANHIVLNHNGKIEVRSRWGYETEFIIRLPAVRR